MYFTYAPHPGDHCTCTLHTLLIQVTTAHTTTQLHSSYNHTFTLLIQVSSEHCTTCTAQLLSRQRRWRNPCTAHALHMHCTAPPPKTMAQSIHRPAYPHAHLNRSKRWSSRRMRKRNQRRQRQARRANDPLGLAYSVYDVCVCVCERVQRGIWCQFLRVVTSPDTFLTDTDRYLVGAATLPALEQL